MSHLCPVCGDEHEGMTEVIHAPESAPATEANADAAVEIARIQAERDVKVEKLYTERATSDDQQRIAELEGEVAGLRQAVQALQAPATAAALSGALDPEPEPEPEPIVVVPEPEPELPPVDVATPPESTPPDKPAKRGGGWFD